MNFKLLLKKERAATLIEYAILLTVFLGIFIFFGNKLLENSVKRANETQDTIAKIVPCSKMNSSEYLLGSRQSDRDVCID